MIISTPEARMSISKNSLTVYRWSTIYSNSGRFLWIWTFNIQRTSSYWTFWSQIIKWSFVCWCSGINKPCIFFLPRDCCWIYELWEGKWSEFLFRSLHFKLSKKSRSNLLTYFLFILGCILKSRKGLSQRQGWSTSI